MSDRIVEITKVSDTKFVRKIVQVIEEVTIDLVYLEDQKKNIQNQKDAIIADFDSRIAKIDAQIQDAKSKGVKTKKQVADETLEVNR